MMPTVLERVVRLRPAQAWLCVLLSMDVAALVDLLAGPEIWFGPVYLLVICLAAWSLGWKGGQLTGICCMALTFALNGFTLYPYSGAIEVSWNLAMRIIAISLVVAIVAGLRRAYLREWWTGRIDQLTGALTRQAFFELAPTAVSAHCWRLLIYADIDGLKKINDVQGHSVGDAYLRAYGSALAKMIRRDDIFARVGGDEFLILMNVRDEAAARTVAARLHEAMNRISVRVGTVRCSVGGLAIPPGRASIAELVRSADTLMYQAKQRGASLQQGVASCVRPPARVETQSVPAFSDARQRGTRRSPTERRHSFR